MDDQRLHLAIINYLKNTRASADVQIGEVLDVAIECCAEAFGVNVADAVPDSEAATLPKIFTAGEEALQNAETARQNEELAQEYKAKGNQFLKDGDIENAIDMYSQAIQNALSPELLAVFYGNRAAAYSHLGDHVAAESDSRKAIELNPRYAKAHKRLGFALERQGKKKLAVEQGYSKALELSPAAEAHDIQAAIDRCESTVDDAPPQPAAAGNPFASLNLGNLGEMFNNPAFQEMASNVAQNIFGGGEGAPDLSNLSNVFAGMGMPAAQNPGENNSAPAEDSAFAGMADRIRNNPQLAQFKDDPRMEEVLEVLKKDGPTGVFGLLSKPEYSDLFEAISGQLGSLFNGSEGSGGASQSGPSAPSAPSYYN